MALALLDPPTADPYADEVEAWLAFERLLWPDGPTCPHCGGQNVKFLPPANGRTRKTHTGASTLRRTWHCRDCRKRTANRNAQFSVLVGTPLHRTRVPLTKWMLAIHLFRSNPETTPWQFTTTLQITARAGYEIARRLGEAEPGSPFWNVLHGEVDLDGKAAEHRLVVVAPLIREKKDHINAHVRSWRRNRPDLFRASKRRQYARLHPVQEGIDNRVRRYVAKYGEAIRTDEWHAENLRRLLRGERLGDDPAYLDEQRRRWREANRDHLRTQQRHWREINRERVAAQQRRWREANRDVLQARSLARTTRTRAAEAKWNRYRELLDQPYREATAGLLDALSDELRGLWNEQQKDERRNQVGSLWVPSLDAEDEYGRDRYARPGSPWDDPVGELAVDLADRSGEAETWDLLVGGR